MSEQDKTPKALEAEIGVLGSFWLHPEGIPDITEIINVDDFHQPRHRVIYSAITSLYDDRLPIDSIHVHRYLSDRGELEAAGGLNYIELILESTPMAGTLGGYHAKLVRDKADLRRLLEVADKIRESVSNDGHLPARDHIEAALAKLMALGEAHGKLVVEPFGNIVDDVMTEIEARADSADPPPLGLATGIHDLDDMLSGLEDGTLTILAARTSVGKTALAMQITEYIAASARVAVFTLEMNRKQLGYRHLAIKSGVSARTLRKAKELDFAWDRLRRAVIEAKGQAVDICLCPGLSLGALRSAAERMKARGVKLIIVDHLGLMRIPRAENRNIALGELTAGIKTLASELSLPIILLCQLNREADRRGRPQLTDLRESGHIEEDADNIILIHRPEFEDRKKAGAIYNTPEPVELIVAKNRQGPCGGINLHFDAPTMTFRSVVQEGSLL